MQNFTLVCRCDRLVRDLDHNFPVISAGFREPWGLVPKVTVPGVLFR